MIEFIFHHDYFIILICCLFIGVVGGNLITKEKKKPTQTGKTQPPLRIKKPGGESVQAHRWATALPRGTWGPGSNQRPCEWRCLQEKTSQGEWWCIIPFSYQYSEWVSNEYSVMTCCNVQRSRLHSALHRPSLPAGTVSVSSLLPHAVLMVTENGHKCKYKLLRRLSKRNRRVKT